MSETKFEKKRSIWPFVIIFLGLISATIYLYYSLTTLNDDNMAGNGDDTEVNEEDKNRLLSDSTVSDYIAFVTHDSLKMGLDHSYTNSALVRLARAIDAKASEVGVDVKVDLDKAKEHAGRITADPFETSHADNIRIATDILATALANIQNVKYRSLSADVEELKNASASINPDVLTLNQKGAVKSYFSKAADLLDKMN